MPPDRRMHLTVGRPAVAQGGLWERPPAGDAQCSTLRYPTVPRLHRRIATCSRFHQVAAQVRDVKILVLGQYVHCTPHCENACYSNESQNGPAR
jgi:hypothetical protein